MTRPLTFTVVLACAAALLGAAGLGCSNADRRVPQVMTRPAPPAEPPLTEAEQAVKDVRVALAVAAKVRDAASYGTEQLNRVGDVTVTRRLSGWEDTDGVTGWHVHGQFINSGARYTTLSQSYRDGSSGWFMPWYDDDGNLVLEVGTGLAHRPLQDNPAVWAWRSVNTSVTEPAGRTSSHAPIEDHGLGAAWQGFEVTKTYDDTGTLTMRVFTDLTAADNLGVPFVSHPAGDAAYPDAALDAPAVPALPAGRDGQWVYAGDGLRGSLNGARGSFSCADGVYGYCGLETGPGFLAPGYTADVAADPVIFTPDNGSTPLRLPHPAPIPVASVNYLSFGSWQYVPQDVTDFDAYDFGLFASGGDPFRVANLRALTGTASYAGDASGTYADDVDATLSPFSAKVALSADFGSRESFGRILGVVYGFEIEGGKASPLRSLNLNAAPWRDPYDNIFDSWPDGGPLPGGLVEGWTSAEVGTARWRGSWGGVFYGNSAAASLAPTAFAGTFGATDGEATFAGSFGARRR